MGKPRALVLTGYGINTDYETAHAFSLPSVGGDGVRVHLNDLIAAPQVLRDYQMLVIPGGFSFGDDIASGKVLAVKLRAHLLDALCAFVDRGRLVLGICNGFQVLVKLGLLPNLAGECQQDVTLTFNDSGRFEDRWVYLTVDPAANCIFTMGMDRVYLPVRHGEGKFIPRDMSTLATLEARHCIVMRYVDKDGERAGYPWNPNGSVGNIAGVCDVTGRVFGLMPHPEAYQHFTNHPRWTREPVPAEGMGVQLFRNAVAYVNEALA
ncbi:MAG TPA: phosphoribosylformylglycinamidine synthase I [Candidatus Tectomicrobia bacterium]|nr:phosphoribosylformylglycinamidine synthase I [Candidatus Tectomicrobia bacterium]